MQFFTRDKRSVIFEIAKCLRDGRAVVKKVAVVEISGSNMRQKLSFFLTKRESAVASKNDPPLELRSAPIATFNR